MYTYEEWLKKAQNDGLYEQFSDADKKLAMQNPDAGMSLLNYKNDFRNATTDDQRALINVEANALRKNYGNYTAGSTGSGYYSTGKSPASYTKPSYESPYTGQIASQLNKVQGSTFSYDHEKDPAFSAYKKQYTREGDRATKNALGAAAANTGGIASTAAVTAAGQAGQYYASQLTDKIPELKAQAYNEYMQQKNADLAILNALESLESNNYSKYANERNFDYSQLLDDIEAGRQTEQTEYNRQKYAEEQERERLKTVAMDLAALGDYSLYKQLFPEANTDLMKKGFAATKPKLNQALYGTTPTGGYSYRAGSGNGGGNNSVKDNNSKSDLNATTTESYEAVKNEVEQFLNQGATKQDIEAAYKQDLSDGRITKRDANRYWQALKVLTK